MNKCIIEILSKVVTSKDCKEQLDILIGSYEKLECKKQKCNKNQILAINYIDNWSDAIQHEYFLGCELNEENYIDMASEIIDALENGKDIKNEIIISMCLK